MTDIERIKGSAAGRCKSVIANGMVWTVATAPGDSVTEQTRAALTSIEANLIEAGTGKGHIVDATIYLTDMETKTEMDAVWCAWIPDDGWPCRACVGTSLAGSDQVEIKVTAVLPSGSSTS